MRIKTFEQMKSGSVGISGEVVACTGGEPIRAAPLKINKPDNLTFSGQARDFATFKRDFLAIVVPNRDAAQVGIYFKQAIPEKHKHLLANKDLTDWSGMMSIIEE